MRFLYCENAGNDEICVNNEQFLHLKARRARLGERIDVRNLRDGANYLYEITEFGRKSANLKLVFKNSVVGESLNFEIAWCVVESAVIEKTLPSLNEMGVKALHLVFSDFSQKNIKLDLARFERILIASSEQCGRNSILKIEIYPNLSEFLAKFPNTARIDFGGKNLATIGDEIPLIGPEGGFSENERALIKNSYALRTPFILRANTAVLMTAAQLL